MSDEYQNNLQGNNNDVNSQPAEANEFATTAEAPVEEVVAETAPVEEPAEDNPPIEELSSVSEPDNTTPPVYENNAPQPQPQPQPQPNDTFNQQGYVPPYSSPYQPQQNNVAPGYGYNNYSNPGMYPPPAEPSYEPKKKKKKGLTVFLIILAAVIFVGIVFGSVSFVVRRTIGTNNVVDSYTSLDTEEDEDASENAPVLQIAPSNGEILTPAEVAAKVKPSVVAIIVYSNNSGGIASEGSGVLWKEDDDGKYTYIITCAHVVSGAGYSYTVQTEDGTQYDAELIGADAKTDLGVIRIEATGLSLAEFGDSSALRVGDPVYAIGNPGGTEFFGSFTDGIVSAIDRSVQSTYTMICIQHTAAINPGNSGGALVNAYGQVIGINSLKIIDTEYEGMGFAVPIKSAQPIINSLAAYGYVPNRPKLGISYTEAINYQQYSMIIKIKGLPSGSLIITEINADSSLANTEAKQYDMIIAVDGEDMTTPNVLLDKIENGSVGDEITLTLCRIDNNYQTTEFDVTVKLVEEKKAAEEETTTSPQMIDPFDYFNGMFW